MSLLGFGWLRDEIDALRTAEPTIDPGALAEQVHELRKRVVELAATATVLEALLVEAKVVDVADIRRRVATIVNASAIVSAGGRIRAAGCERA